jgi:hypothetical protein
LKCPLRHRGPLLRWALSAQLALSIRQELAPDSWRSDSPYRSFCGPAALASPHAEFFSSGLIDKLLEYSRSTLAYGLEEDSDREEPKQFNAMSWYILRETDVLGPIDDKETDLKLSRGEIARDAMIGRRLEGPWGLASSVFPLAFGIISVTAVPPVFTTDNARRLLAPAIPGARNVKSAPVPLGISPAASSASEMGHSGGKVD